MFTADNTRVYRNIPPINKATNDTTTENGVRICTPIYIDPPVSLRKQLLNAVREISHQPSTVSTPNTLSGISVVNSCSRHAEVESYLGMTIDNLRNVLFQRGGLEVSLVLKLQQVTGIEVFADKDITAAFKGRQALVKEFAKEYPFES